MFMWWCDDNITLSVNVMQNYVKSCKIDLQWQEIFTLKKDWDDIRVAGWVFEISNKQKECWLMKIVCTALLIKENFAFGTLWANALFMNRYKMHYTQTEICFEEQGKMVQHNNSVASFARNIVHFSLSINRTTGFDGIH